MRPSRPKQLFRVTECVAQRGLRLCEVLALVLPILRENIPVYMVKPIEPIRRGSEPKWVKYILAIVVICIVIGFTQEWSVLPDVAAHFLVYHLLLRLCYLREEMVVQLPVRYNNNKKEAWERVIGTIPETLLFVAATIYCIVVPFIYKKPSLYWIFMWCSIAFRLIMSESQYEQNPFIAFRLIGDKHSGLFYGISMAYSYFHGYLDIILPDKGYPGEEHFLERLDEYIETERSSSTGNVIYVPDRRLHILVPSSGEAPVDIAEYAYGWMEKCKNLKSVRRNRGGVRERIYHNTVYRIKNPNERGAKAFYVVVEYATPLITYHEACRYKDGSWRSSHKDTVISFFETCKDVLMANPSCNQKVHLVYFEDRDENGKHVNVAKVLIESIKKSLASN